MEHKYDAIKLENYKKIIKIFNSWLKTGIPVMGHIGFTPQFKKEI